MRFYHCFSDRSVLGDVDDQLRDHIAQFETLIAALWDLIRSVPQHAF